jgi:ATP-dependent DNA helicase RecG
MDTESITIEYKSLRKVTSGDAGFKDLAVTCVCFANTLGGKIVIGIEDKDREPPSNQTISNEQMNATISRLRSLCFNVGLVLNDKETHPNGGEYFSIAVQPALKSLATTSDGKVYIRIGDQCQSARGEDILRIATEKDAFQWELQLRNYPISQIDTGSIAQFSNEIRASDRVKQFVKDFDDIAILEHYNLIQNNILTNLGVLWLGTPQMRSRLVYPITVQYLVYDELDKKVRKEEWLDYTQTPKELILDIEQKAVELTYFDEFPQGFFRNKIPHYDKRLVRELLINAFVHKSFSISGDIFIKVYPDRLEITNPGGLPLGITKDNILHTTSRRNPHLIRVFHDLKLMEGEGSGFDLMYEIASRDSKPYPVPISDFNTTTVVQYSEILDEEALMIIDFIGRNYQLTQKETIALGVVARHKKILATNLTKALQLTEEDRLRTYVSKLIERHILITRGIKKGTEYLINPKLISSAKINVKPTLKVIEPHRLEALIEADLGRYPKSQIIDVYKRLEDVPIEDIRKKVYSMVKKGILEHTTDKTYRRYWLAKKNRIEKENK